MIWFKKQCIFKENTVVVYTQRAYTVYDIETTINLDGSKERLGDTVKKIIILLCAPKNYVLYVFLTNYFHVY